MIESVAEFPSIVMADLFGIHSGHSLRLGQTRPNQLARLPRRLSTGE
jgi:hypothetical protein